MKKLSILLLLVVFLSGCYTVTQVGNCKYYYRKDISSKYKVNKPISF